ncbi:hypothetical protein FXW07_07210 [Methanosarcina sp. DH1]|uniref:helix-turn-helix domain-containing protein n=1 Tax=Methanosarcina sp. DH1 TaxID=2605695 RepID=UPI001E635312|nr:helix-turn-helix domain-containing protein [Methanosarcina sp. DH1]MCC4766408.1 hypothetical protein [Methanosarcina sp. DH1]
MEETENESIEIRFYHKYNFLKLRIMDVLMWASQPMTCRQIAERLDVPAKNVSRILCHYIQHHYGYFRRLKPLEGSNAYLYKINKKGIRAYLEYMKRLKLGFDLNRNRHTPRRMPTYKGFNRIDFKKPESLIIKPEEAEPYYYPKFINPESNIIC